MYKISAQCELDRIIAIIGSATNPLADPILPPPITRPSVARGFRLSEARDFTMRPMRVSAEKRLHELLNTEKKAK